MLFETKTALQRWLQKHKCLSLHLLYLSQFPACVSYDFSFRFDSHLCDVPNINATDLEFECISRAKKKINELSVINFVQASRCET